MYQPFPVRLKKRLIAATSVFIGFLILTACSGTNVNQGSTTTFHPLSDLTFIQTEKDHHGNSYSVKNDFIVVANPPTARESLQRLIEAYNAKTLSKKELTQQFGYIRHFYKESKNMPRDYKESHKGYFNVDRWEKHGDDLLVLVKWGEFGKELNYEFR